MFSPNDIKNIPVLKPMRMWIALALIFLAIELIPLCSHHMADTISLALAPWGRDNAFTWLIVHHICLLSLTILVMMLISPVSLSDWGFNFNNWQLGLKIILIFAVAFSFIEYLYMSGQPYVTEYPQTSVNKLGMLGFQFLLSGLGEEPFFRGFVIIILLGGLSTTTLSFKQQYIIVLFVSTIVFMYAHLHVDWLGMSVTGFDFGQQTKALQLGVLYAVVFIHTRSLFAPIVLHGLSNGITATIGFYVV